MGYYQLSSAFFNFKTHIDSHFSVSNIKLRFYCKMLAKKLNGAKKNYFGYSVVHSGKWELKAWFLFFRCFLSVHLIDFELELYAELYVLNKNLQCKSYIFNYTKNRKSKNVIKIDIERTE